MHKPKVVVTLFTPFTSDNRIDESALRESIAYYNSAGVDGVFANCQTSETLKLTADERLATVRIIADCKKNLILYSGMNQGDSLVGQTQQLQAACDAGADMPVVWLSTLPKQQSLDDELLTLADNVDGDIGIYECPDPVHRLLEDDQLIRISQSGRYAFFKDTCRDNDRYAQRMKLIEGTRLKSYQANWQCLPQSIRDRSAGFSGWLAAARPDAVVAYCKPKGDDDSKEPLHQALFNLQEAMRAAGYPASGKHLLARHGIPMNSTMRNDNLELVSANADALQALEAADDTIDAILDSFNP